MTILNVTITNRTDSDGLGLLGINVIGVPSFKNVNLSSNTPAGVPLGEKLGLPFLNQQTY